MAKYIDNKRFEVLILEYKKGNVEVEDELFEMFYTLVSKIYDGFRFSIDKENASQDCMLLIVKTLKDFDPNRGKAFNFFTTLIVNNLKKIFTKEKRHTQKIDNYTEHVKYLTDL